MLALLAAVIGGSLAALTLLYVNADRQRRIAEHREAGERAIVGFYENYVLAAARPQGYWGGLGKDATLKAALDQAAFKIGEVFADQPELEAEVRGALGMTYFHLGQFDAAIPHLEQAYAIRRARLGPDDPHTLRSQHELAMLRWKQGRFDEAVALGRQALGGRRRVLGREHVDTLWTQLNLGLFLMNVGQFDESEVVLRDAIKICRQSLGPDHHHTLYGQNDLSVVLYQLGNVEESIALDRATLAGRQRSLGPEHPDTLRSMGNLASVLADAGQLDEAEQLARQALELRSRVLGEAHEETMWSKEDLAKVLQERVESGDAASFVEAQQLYRQVFTYCRENSLPRDGWIIRTLADYCQLLTDAGRGPEAETFFRDFLAMIEQQFPERRAVAANTRSLLGSALTHEKRFAEAEPLLTASYEEIDRAPSTTPKIRAAAVQRVIALYEQWGRADQAATWRQKR